MLALDPAERITAHDALNHVLNIINRVILKIDL